MAEKPAEDRPTLAVFATSALPGDADYTRIVSNAGTLFARNGARLVCLIEDGVWCRPLVTAALAAGGSVIMISDGSLAPEKFAKGVEVELIEEEEARFHRMSELADAFVGFPIGIAAARALFNVWSEAGGGSSGKPVALLNRNRAFEVFRGFSMDVLSHSLSKSDRMMLFADTVEDLWNQLKRNLG